jgi:hypothetical protein
MLPLMPIEKAAREYIFCVKTGNNSGLWEKAVLNR